MFTDQNFNDEVLKSEIPVLVDFFAIWCGPCQMMAPIIDEAQKKFGPKIKVGKIDVDENSQISEKYQIAGIPNFKIFSKGKVIGEISGAMPKEIFFQKVQEIVENNSG